MPLHNNISGSITQELLAVGDNISVNSVSICNIHATDPVVVDLYIGKCDAKYYIIKNYTLGHGSTLTLEKEEVSFNNNTNQYGLFIKLNNTDSATDVIIRT